MIGALLLASVAAVPAVAQDKPHGGWHQNGGDHGDRGGGDRGGDRGGGREARGDGGNRGGGAPQAQPAQRPDVQRPQPGGSGGDRGGGRPQGGAGFQPQGNPDGGHRVYGRPDNGVQVWRNDRGTAQRPDWSNRPGAGWDRNHDGRPDGNRPGGWDRDHDGRPDGNRQGGWDRNHDGRPDGGWDRGGRPGNNWNGNRGGGWNSGWRNDRRYDWRGWRNTHRDYYRVGPYRAPYGYGGGYRRWGIGARLNAIFFAQDYWIDNPDYYRLPPAYGNYRWVRYYNDALLVDVYSGTVVDEIPDFFW